jgi:hypothetical protein
MSTPPPPPPYPSYRPPPGGNVYRPTGNNGKALASMVCGIVGLVVFGFILGIIAIVLGSIAKNEIRRTGQGGYGMATAGIVLGIIDIIAGIFIVAALVN